MRVLSGEAQHRNMTQTPIPRLVVSSAVPTTISQLITVIYNTADTFFVSQTGTSAAAAVGVVFSLMALIQAVGFGLGMGAASLISRQLGAKEHQAANRCGSSAFFAAVLFGLCLLAMGLPCCRGLMRLFGATDTILPYAVRYARWILLGAPLLCASFVLSDILKAEGEAALSMWGLCAGGLLNLALDPLLIFGAGLGISGAAIATVLSQGVSFCILLRFFLLGKSIVRLHPRFVSRRWRDYQQILQTGFPSICRQGLSSLSSALLNLQAAPYGDGAVAAITIANRLYMLVRNLVLGIGQGFQPVAGYNYGAGEPKRVREAFVFACRLGTAVCLGAAILLAANSGIVMGWFRKDDLEVIALGRTALLYNCGVLGLLAYSTYVNQLYQCLGFSKPATLLACCRQGIFFLPLVLLLPHWIGFSGVQMTQAGADLCTFLLSVPFQISFFRKHLRTA